MNAWAIDRIQGSDFHLTGQGGKGEAWDPACQTLQTSGPQARIRNQGRTENLVPGKKCKPHPPARQQWTLLLEMNRKRVAE